MRALEVTVWHPIRLERLVMFNPSCLIDGLAGGSVVGDW